MYFFPKLQFEYIYAKKIIYLNAKIILPPNIHHIIDKTQSDELFIIENINKNIDGNNIFK